MAKVLIYSDFQNGKVKAGTLELLNAAKLGGHDITTVAFGAGSKDVSNELGKHGSTKHLYSEADSFSKYNSELFTEALSQVISSESPSFVLASGTALTKDLFPRTAAKVKAGIASDCTELTFDGDNAKIRKPLYAGKCTAQVNFKNCDVKMVIMRPNQLPVGEEGTSDVTAEEFSFTPSETKSTTKEVAQSQSQKADLTEAATIVSGGRGLQGPENFKLLEELSETIGATVGASRAVVDAGWVPHSMQVGQTGKTVAPNLYIAAGISGAIQHLAGMSSSRVIVAINKDSEAPIFKKSTYGIVGDALEVLPKLNEEFKKIMN